MNATLTLSAIVLLLTGCVVAPAIKSQTGASSVANSPTKLSSLTAVQDEQIKNALVPKLQDFVILQAIKEAVPSLYRFIKIESCLSTNTPTTLLNAYAAPRIGFSGMTYGGGPVVRMKFHDKSLCASVLRIQGWNMPTKNSLKFEIVYTSEISGETIKLGHEIVKQASGDWLFTE